MPSQTHTADEILSYARSLILAGGYKGFSYADIADVVGIRKASIHHHFPSKVDLVRELVSRYRQEAESGIAELERLVPDPLEQLRQYIGYWERCISDATAPYCICALLAGELPQLPQEIAVEVRAHFRLLSAWIASILERGVQRGGFQLSSSPHVEAEAILATVHGAMLSARAYGDPKVFGLITAPLLHRLSK